MAFTCIIVLAMTLAPARAAARSFYVRTTSASELSQTRRLDASLHAPRLLLQGVELHGYDLLDDQSGSLNARFAMRYLHDFTHATDTLSPAPLPMQNDLRLDLLYLQWRPTQRLELKIGRQWAWSALGPRDFDGAQLTLNLPLSSHQLSFSAFAGQDAQLGLSPLGPSIFDAQGIPLLPAHAPTLERRTLAGAHIDINLKDYIWISLAYQRRDYQSPDLPGQRLLGEERAAAAVAASLTRSITTDATLIYNAYLRNVERAEWQTAWRLRPDDPHSHTVAMSLARRRPWFDASSIFNLFGAAPYDDAQLSWRRGDPRGTRLGMLEARAWARTFHGDLNSFDLGRDPRDARAAGGALSLARAFPIQQRSLRLSSTVSHQRAPDDYGGAQWLADATLTAPSSPTGPSLYARAIMLRTTQDHPRHPDASALSAILGLDTRMLATGTLRLVLEQRMSSHDVASTNLYALFTLERWP